MAIEHAGDRFSFQAATDMSTYQYKLVKLSTSTAFTVEVISAALDNVFGVLQNTPSASQNADVMILGGGGFSKVSADAAISVGSRVFTSTDGQVASARYGVGATGTGFLIGFALEAATAAGDVITVALNGTHNAGSA
jgi:hypothetical protein